VWSLEKDNWNATANVHFRCEGGIPLCIRQPPSGLCQGQKRAEVCGEVYPLHSTKTPVIVVKSTPNRSLNLTNFLSTFYLLAMSVTGGLNRSKECLPETAADTFSLASRRIRHTTRASLNPAITSGTRAIIRWRHGTKNRWTINTGTRTNLLECSLHSLALNARRRRKTYEALSAIINLWSHSLWSIEIWFESLLFIRSDIQFECRWLTRSELVCWC